MKDYIILGPAPANEECAQIGEDGFEKQNKEECLRLIRELKQRFGEEPQGAQLATKSFDHDFGTYREVVCHYDDAWEEAKEYAFKLEEEFPEYWIKENE